MPHPYYYRVTILQLLAASIENNTRLLNDMNTALHTPGVAWAARNLLELQVWTAYCCTSEENARRFLEDGKRDAISGLTIPDELILEESRESFVATRENMIAQAATEGIENPTQYQRVANVAKEVGFKHFGTINMILSKWAHPTAMCVLDQKPPTDLRDRFYQLGCAWSEVSSKAIRGSLTLASQSV